MIEKPKLKSEQMLQGMKYLHLSPLCLHVQRFGNTRQPFVALVELWRRHRLPSAYRTQTEPLLFWAGGSLKPEQSQLLDQRSHKNPKMLVQTFDCRWWRHPLWFIVFLHCLAHQRGFSLLLPM